MNTVFIGGSRQVSRLPPDVKKRLENVVASGHEVIVGDANGADKAVQKYFFEAHYDRVTVFCSGATPRNNLGSWRIHPVSAPKNAKGFDFYAAKDREMARHADIGFMIWDGKSPGTALNVLRLVRAGKISVLFNVPAKLALNIKSLDQWWTFIAQSSPELRKNIQERATSDEWAGEEVETGPGLLLPLEPAHEKGAVKLPSPAEEMMSALNRALVSGDASTAIGIPTLNRNGDDRSEGKNENTPMVEGRSQRSVSPILDYIKRGPSPEERRYWHSLLNEDDLGAVVRTSTFLESHIETILRRHFVDQTASVNIRGIPYIRRVELAWGLGEFDMGLVKVLRCLDNLRGAYAHNHAYEIDDKTLTTLLSAMSGHVRYVYDHNMKFTFAESSAEVRYATAHLAEQKRKLRAALDAIRTVVGMISRSSFNLIEHILERRARP